MKGVVMTATMIGSLVGYICKKLNEVLKGLVEITIAINTMRINMPIALFGKVEQTTIEKVEHHHHYYNPIFVKDKEEAVQIAQEHPAAESHDSTLQTPTS
jgi:hypothetical protein